MHRILILTLSVLALALVGCQTPYLSLVNQPESQDSDPDGGPTIGPSLPQFDDLEEVEEDQDDDLLPPDRDCGFTVDDGRMNEAFVKSYPSFELLGDEVELIEPGQPIEVSILTTAHECGDIELSRLSFVEEQLGLDWLEEIYELRADVHSEDWEFQSTPPVGVSFSELSDELHFTWTDGRTYTLGLDNAGEMESVLIPAGESVELTFSFTFTESAPSGTIVEAWLSTVAWLDVETDQMINSYIWDQVWKTTEFE